MRGSEMFEDRVVVSPIEIVWKSNRVILTRSRRFIQNHDSIRVWVRQGLQQYCVDDAEDRGVHANAQRQCQNGDRTETRLLPQHSECVSNILFQTLELFVDVEK